MYRKLFGFRKNPFRQAPDPAYLFLGKHHEEAVAHLTYAVMEGEGFILITGDHGVGKTTVCRSFVERLSEDVLAAYIECAAALEPLQLLQKIAAAFGIRSKFDTIKDLTDALNSFLINKKREAKTVALFLDDAHRLSSAVLEQVRLLSNLETTRDKLLQIVLIGRSDLAEMLASRALRQIGQRVSVRCHIHPLSLEETVAYVQHRISLSSDGPPVRFDQAAIRPVHRYSGGIPRRINKACDRILKAAYENRESRITEDLAKKTLRNMDGRREPTAAAARQRKWLPMLGAAAVCLLAVLGAVWRSQDQSARKITVAIGKSPAAEALSSTPSEPRPAAASADATDGVEHREGPAASIAVKNTPGLDTLSEKAEPSTRPQRPADDLAVAPAGAGDRQEFAAPEPVAEAQKEALPTETMTLSAVLDSVRLQHDLDRPQAVEIDPGGVAASMAYSIQVGAFLLQANAERRAAQLARMGYAPQITTVKDPGGRTWHTVRIGDYPTREEAQVQAEAFTARENRASAVRPYNAY